MRAGSRVVVAFWIAASLVQAGCGGPVDEVADLGDGTASGEEVGEAGTRTSAVVAATVAGRTAGSWSVTGYGQGSYTVPIQVPPGTGGVAPELSIQYAGGARPGLLGAGFRLGGTSAITRCPPTVAQDGRRGAVEVDGRDRFCLDGNRLVLVAGTYGANGAEYRTEIESFNRIFSYGVAGSGPAWFQVTSRGGTTLQYGNAGGSRVVPLGSTTAIAWANNRVTDESGNYLTISYGQNAANGEYWPTRVDYTGNASAVPALAPYAAVTFSYVNRGDVEVTYLGGFPVKSSKLLSRIETWVDGGLVKSYALEYARSAARPRSRLTSVQECDGVGRCLAPTTFGWPEGQPEFGMVRWATGQGGDRADMKWFEGDFNGDGKTDLMKLWDDAGAMSADVHLSTGTAFSAVRWATRQGGYWHQQQWFVGDFNGDGKTDLMKHWDDGGTMTADVHLSTGTAFSAVRWATQQGGVSPTMKWMVGDFNGDGRADLMKLWDDAGAMSADVHLSTGTAFSAVRWATKQGGIWPTMKWMAGDFDGDGKTDLMKLWGDAGMMTADVHLSTGTAFGMARWATQQNGYTPVQQWSLGDFNGDGKTDLMKLWDDVGTMSADVHLSTGRAFVVQGWARKQGGYWSTQRWRIGDYDGDGRTDLLKVFDDAGMMSADVHRSTSTAFVMERWATRQGGWLDEMRWRGGDFDGDGKDDLAKLWTEASRLNADVHASAARPDLLVKVRDGYGSEVTVQYEPITRATVYTAGSGAVYPVQDVRSPLYVVAATATDDGIGGLATILYSYGGLRVDLNRGPLGFRWMESLDTTNNLETRATFHQGWPYLGMTVSSEQRLNGVLISSITNTLANVEFCTTVSPAPPAGTCDRNLPFVSSSVERRYELTGALVTTKTTSNVLDGYGNPVSVTTAVAAGTRTWRSVVSNTYLNDTAAWVLGKLTRTSNTNTQPDATTATRTSAFTYDARGRVASETVEPDSITLRQQTAHGYDVFGNRTSSTVSGPGIAARTSRVTFDAKGRFPVGTENALGHTTSLAYDGRFGAVTSATDENGLVVTSSYDGFGRKAGESRPDGTSTTITYTTCGSCPPHGAYYVTQESTGKPRTRDYLDRLDRKIRNEAVGFDGRLVHADAAYNGLGQQSRNSLPYFAGSAALWTTFAYDGIGRGTSVTEPSGAVTSTTYGGLTTTVTNALGQAVTKVQDPLGRVTSATDAGGTMSYVHDPFGNVLSATDPLGNRVTSTYDIRGNKIGTTDPDLGVWTYRYDALGQRIGATDAKGQVTSFSYDLLGRMVERSQPGQVDTWIYDTAPNGKGKLAEASTNSWNRRTQAYDALGRSASVTTTIDGESLTVATGYDVAGRLATTTYPTGFAVKRVYNASGYLAEVRKVSDNALIWQGTAVNADGRPTRLTLGNGLNVNYGYDAATGWIEGITAGATNGTGVQNATFAYDLIGNLTARAEARTGVSERFTYDGLNRLTRSDLTTTTPAATTTSSVSYTYDAIGRLTSKSDVGNYAYHATRKHALAGVAGTVNTTFTYDGNGNTLTGNGRSFTWTAWDMPATIASGVDKDTFTYDADHRRVKRDATGSGTTYYLNARWDAGINFEREYPAAGGVNDRHSIYAGDDAPVAIYTSGRGATGLAFSNLRYLHHDHLGSVAVITNETGGVVERRSYDPHGKPRATSGSPVMGKVSYTVTPHGFTGHEMLQSPGTTNARGGLVHMNGRVYDPDIGRFLSADPKVDMPLSTQGYDRYAYAGNNPLSHVDLDGHSWVSSAFKKASKAIGRAFNSIKGAVQRAGVWLARNPAAAAIIGTVVGLGVGSLVTGGLYTLVGTTAQAAAIHAVGTFAAVEAAGALAGGFVTGYISSGFNPKAGLTSAATAVGFSLAGTVAGIPSVAKSIGEVGRAGMHAVVGCASAAATGGSCGAGAASAAFGSLASPYAAKLGGAAGLVATSAVGGISSKIAGGSFRDGALTAAAGYTYNMSRHDPRWPDEETIDRMMLEAADMIRAHPDFGRVEHSYSIGYNSEGRLEVGWFRTGGTGSVVPYVDRNTVAIVHSHPRGPEVTFSNYNWPRGSDVAFLRGDGTQDKIIGGLVHPSSKTAVMKWDPYHNDVELGGKNPIRPTGVNINNGYHRPIR